MAWRLLPDAMVALCVAGSLAGLCISVWIGDAVRVVVELGLLMVSLGAVVLRCYGLVGEIDWLRCNRCWEPALARDGAH